MIQRYEQEHKHQEQKQSTPPFELTQTYFTKIFNIIRGITSKKPVSYEQELKAIHQKVMEWLKPSMLKISFNRTKTFKTIFKQLCASSSIIMLANVKSFFVQHLDNVMKNWVNNHIKASISKQDYENTTRSKFKKWKQNLDQFAFYSKYKTYKATMDKVIEAINNETEKKNNSEKKDFSSVMKGDLLMKSMKIAFQLKKDVEELMKAYPDRDFKQISFLPQNKINMGYINIDSTVLAAYHLCQMEEKKGQNTLTSLSSTDKQKYLWSQYFDLQKIKNLKKSYRFNYAISTDGVGVSIRYEKMMKRASKKKKDRIYNIHSISQGLHGGQTIIDNLDRKTMDFSRLCTETAFVSIDPGVRSILTGCILGQEQKQILPHNLSKRQIGRKKARLSSVFCLSQGQYRMESNMNYYLNLKNKKNHKHIQETKVDFDNNPYRKSVNLDNIEKYLKMVATHWNLLWKTKGSRNMRSLRFKALSSKQSFCDKFISTGLKDIQDRTGKAKVVILFGNGNQSGLFGKLKGGGFKGPVKTLQRLLAKHVPVICVDEYRSSQCCFECGSKLSNACDAQKAKKIHAVMYCQDPSHHCMLNRDLSASKKIGVRYLKHLFDGECGVDHLGPWSRSHERINDSSDNVTNGRVLSTFYTTVAFFRSIRVTDGPPLAGSATEYKTFQ